jgi:hypothetical protein
MDARSNGTVCPFKKKLALDPSVDIRYIVIDDFLEDETCKALHAELLSNQMWRQKNPLSKHLHNARPKSALIASLVGEITEQVRQDSPEDIDLIDYWALLYSLNTDGNVHADFGQLTLTYWLTPEHYNLDPATGGLLLYDVCRDPGQGANIYLAAGKESEDYVNKSTLRQVVIPYRCNRAVLFDSSHYHKTHSPNFDISRPEGMRMNLTLAYASAAHVERQFKLIES